MSALPLKTDLVQHDRDVRFVPEAAYPVVHQTPSSTHRSRREDAATCDLQYARVRRGW